MRKILLSTAAAFCLVSGAALAADAQQPGHESPPAGSNTNAVSAVEDTTSAVVGTISAEMTSTARGFVDAAATSDMYEVEAGKIAMKRAHSADLRKFAEDMVTAHTATSAKLKSILASNASLKITPPAHLDNRRQGMIDNLTGAAAADFDKRYISQQEAAHNEAVILFRGYAKDGDNAAIKQFASDTLPKIEEHLNHIRQIGTAMDNMKSSSAQ